MTFDDVLEQTLEMLRRRGRVSYRTLKRQFDLDDAYLEDLKEAILYTYPTVIDDGGRGLIWPSEVATLPRPPPSSSQPAPPPALHAAHAPRTEAAPATPPPADAERR